jgi:pimeloyl-ACP methyl ester carboxylesterase
MEKVKFENSRGLELAGNFWEADSDRGVVMAHGFTGSKEQFGKFTHIATRLNQAGFNVLSFDFSGCGESEDDTIGIEKEVEDLEAAEEFIRSRGVERIVLFGLSQGGLICLESVIDAGAMVLLNPLTSKIEDYRNKLREEQRSDLREKGFAFSERKGEGRNKFKFSQELIEKKETIDQDKALEGVECPVLIIQGRIDETVDPEDSRKAAELVNGRIEMIEDDHYFKHSLRKVSDLSIGFLEEEMKN